MAEAPPVRVVLVAGRPAVLVGPEAVADVHALVADAVRRRHQRREATPGDLAVLEVLRAATSANAAMAGVAACGHDFTPMVAREPALPAQWLTVVGSAQVLGRSPRTVRRLASRGGLPGARRQGRDWVIPAAAVALLAPSAPPDHLEPR